MSMSYLSDDGKAKVRIDVFELPQTDELRNFVHMRVDFLDNIDIKDGDLARNLRTTQRRDVGPGDALHSRCLRRADGRPDSRPDRVQRRFYCRGRAPAQSQRLRRDLPRQTRRERVHCAQLKGQDRRQGRLARAFRFSAGTRRGRSTPRRHDPNARARDRARSRSRPGTTSKPTCS